MDEYLRCLQALWRQDPIEFASEFYTVTLALGPTARAAIAPTGAARRHGRAPHCAAPRRLAHGWIASSRHDLSRIGARVEAVRDRARGRA